MGLQRVTHSALRFHTHRIRNQSPSQVSPHSRQRTHAWIKAHAWINDLIFLYLRGAVRRLEISEYGGLFVVCLSLSSSLCPCGYCAAHCLTGSALESAQKAGRQYIYSNLQGRKWHATLQKQEWKAFCLYMAMHAGCKSRWPPCQVWGIWWHVLLFQRGH